MKKKYLFFTLVILLAITTTLVTPILASTNTHKNLPCSCDDYKDPHHKRQNNLSNHEDKFWSKKNLSLLNNNQRSQLDKLKDKLRKGEPLTDEEKDTLWQLKEIVFKANLGEKEYENFKTIIEKRRSGCTLTEDELNQLIRYYHLVKEH